MKFALDIDDTIAGTNIHWARLCLKIYGGIGHLSSEEILKKYQYVRFVPEWQDNEVIPAFFNSPKKWINIPPIIYASEVVNKLDGKIHCYLTTRPSYLHNVTLQWLSKNNFPIRKIYMPSKEKDVLQWKAHTLMNELSDIDGVIDDSLEFFDLLNKMSYNGSLYSISSIQNIIKNVKYYKNWKAFEYSNIDLFKS